MKKFLLLGVLGLLFACFGCRTSESSVGVYQQKSKGVATDPRLIEKVAGNEPLTPDELKMYFDGFERTEDQIIKDSLAELALRAMLEENRIFFNYDTLEENTTSKLLRISGSLNERDTIFFSGEDITAFASTCAKGDTTTSLGMALSSIQKAFMESESIDTFKMFKDHFEIVYKPMVTGTHKKEFYVKRIEKKLDALTIVEKVLKKSEPQPQKKPKG